MKATIEFNMPMACAWCPLYFRVCRVMPFKTWQKYDDGQERLWVREQRHPKCPLKSVQPTKTTGVRGGEFHNFTITNARNAEELRAEFPNAKSGDIFISFPETFSDDRGYLCAPEAARLLFDYLKSIADYTPKRSDEE